MKREATTEPSPEVSPWARRAGEALQALLLGTLLFVALVYLARAGERVEAFIYEMF